MQKNKYINNSTFKSFLDSNLTKIPVSFSMAKETKYQKVATRLSFNSKKGQLQTNLATFYKPISQGKNE